MRHSGHLFAGSQARSTHYQTRTFAAARRVGAKPVTRPSTARAYWYRGPTALFQQPTFSAPVTKDPSISVLASYTAVPTITKNVPNLISPGLSLSAAISWGAADFSGGVATKTANVFSVVVVAHATGLVFMLLLALLVGEPIPGWSSMLWGAVAGLLGGIGLAAFYKSLAVGTMGINAPLSSVITAVVPLLFSFSTEGLPHAIQMTVFALAMLSISVIAAPRGGASHSKGLGLAVVSGIGFGGFLLCMKLAGSQAVFWPLASARAASFLLMLAIILLTGGEWNVSRSSLSYILAAGILDSGANALYVAATQRGRLDVAAVLSSLYPASTVILARLALKERLSRLQSVGMVTALIAVSMIAGK